MTRAHWFRIVLGAVLVSLGLAASGAPLLAQTSDNEQASSDTLICLAAYAIIVNKAPDDAGAKQGMVITTDIYQALTGKTDEDVSADAATTAMTLLQLDKDGVQPLDTVREHCDAVFMN